MKIEAGQKAPDFSLYDSDKKKVALVDFKGQNVILLFFPLAFTSVCTQELCNMRDNISVYNNLNTQIVAISVDSLYTLARFKVDQQLNFPLLSDFNKEISQAYGSYYDQFTYEMKGVSKRSAFIIDKDGVIRYVEILENPSDLPNFGKINNVLSTLT